MSTNFKLNVARMQAQGSAPASLANAGKIYDKVVSGVTQRFYMDSAGTEYQLTPQVPGAGTVNYAATLNKITLGGGYTLANNTSVQNMWAVARDTITLASTTRYKMRCLYLLSRSTTSTGMALKIGFAGGSATFNSCEYMSSVWYEATGAQSGSIQSNYNFVQTSALTSAHGAASAQKVFTYILDGMIDINAGGTFIPQVQWTSGAGAVTVNTGSFLELIPLGASSFVQQGGWS